MEVSDGYGKNFILKKKLGVEANGANMNDLKLQKAQNEKLAKEQLEAAKAMAASLEEMSVTLSIKAGEGGKAFGSVSSKEDVYKRQPIQAIFTEKGMVNCDSELIFDVLEERECDRMIKFEDVIKIAAEKYNRILNDTKYIYNNAALYYMVDVHSGKESFPVFPAWVLEGYEAGNEANQIRDVYKRQVCFW